MSTACWSDSLCNLGFKSRTPATGCACDGVNFGSSVIREGDSDAGAIEFGRGSRLSAGECNQATNGILGYKCFLKN